MNTPLIFWIVPAASVVALAVAWIFYTRMKREDEGTERMREIAAHVRKGAMAYLRQQYKVVTIVFVALALLFAYLAYGAGVQNPWVPFAFLTGRVLLGACGFLRHEDRNLRLGPHGPCGAPVARPRPEGRLPQRRRHGPRGRGPRTARHFVLVSDSGPFHRRGRGRRSSSSSRRRC